MVSAFLIAGALAQEPRFANETLTMRLRTVLPNGATILVARLPNADRCAVSVVAAARGTAETPETHGHRHLMEHLLALGKGGDVDARLEPRGGRLTASTNRTHMTFTVSAPRAEWQRAAACALEVIRPDAFSTEGIARQRPILEQELALTPAERLLGAAAWGRGYGTRGLDPNGSLATLETATPAVLTELHQRTFAPRNLVVSVAGNLDLDETTRFLTRYLSQLPDLPADPWAPMPDFRPGRTEADARGDARAAAVPPIGNPRSLWVLAAGLGLAASLESAFVAYTPSPQEGLVIVGQTRDRAGANLAFEQADPSALFPTGKRLLRRWLDRQSRSPEALAEFRAVLHLAGTRIETLEEQARAMDFGQFRKGMDAFRTETAVVVAGSR